MLQHEAKNSGIRRGFANLQHGLNSLAANLLLVSTQERRGFATLPLLADKVHDVVEQMLPIWASLNHDRHTSKNCPTSKT